MLKVIEKETAEKQVNAIHKAALLAISTPTIVYLEPFYNLESVQKQKGKQVLVDLVGIFLKGDLSAYEQFTKQHQAELVKQGLVLDHVTKKFKMFALTQLCSQYMNQSLPYDNIRKSLKVSEDVEEWILNSKVLFLFFSNKKITNLY